ncbi:MAG: LysM peptidoglycan-binding domain-containing protein [Fimbriimonadaceae bacterium]|nr:LysM peptidoglycan-binding domain-containing protein [Chitinophagales bacterium]
MQITLEDKNMKRICLLIILVICALSVFSAPNYAKGDSVGIKNIDGNTYIIYKISGGETAYAVSRKYGIPFSSIAAANPDVDMNGIKAGQDILVPAKHHTSVSHTETSEVKKETKQEIKKAELPINDVVIDDDKSKAVSEEINTEEVSGINVETTATNSPVDIQSSTLPKTDKNKPFSTTFAEYPYNSTLVSASDKGVATWIDGSNDLSITNERYYALHNSAPIGSVIKIRNLMNNRTIYAKVIGTLSAGEVNEKVTVKLSAGAAEKLNVLDNRFVVETTYFTVKNSSTSQK